VNLLRLRWSQRVLVIGGLLDGRGGDVRAAGQAEGRGRCGLLRILPTGGFLGYGTANDIYTPSSGSYLRGIVV
jgi:hypothetical protein